VDINLPTIRDQAARQGIADRAVEIALQAKQIYARIQSPAP
jgi:formiminotetrahydrofolate cyclodeaminase